MAAAARVEQYLNRKGLAFELVPVTPSSRGGLESAVLGAAVDRRQVIRSTALIDLKGVLLVVHPFDSSPDLDAIEALVGRRFQPLTATQAGRLFSDCAPGFLPPFGSAYGIPVVVEQSLYSAARVIMACGSSSRLMVLDGRDFRLALGDAGKGHVTIRHSGDIASGVTLEEVAGKLQKLYRLPPMPALALRILRLTSDSEASAKDLAELIEFDPSLTAQIIRYARSALFNYPGQIQSVQEAVTRVLGFERVAHIALGIASVRAFDIPRSGPLGMDQFWRHSLYCAFVCQRMAPLCDADTSLAYLCGLLHNFGLLLVGHLFPTEFSELNRLRAANPEVSMRTLEQKVFGGGGEREMLTVGHGVIGGILHKLWQMPDEVVKSAGVHQQLDYEGDHKVYVRMVQLANGLLKDKGVGDEFNPDNVDALAAELGLDGARLERLRAEVDEVADDLDSLAQALSS
ncbi:HD-like signal output (HDOD) domain, no enzymatic activity [Marinobacter daqiaonensis]|uniref:HD-like signal output (HDOD) domain, no enzymatic activity n=1 Tax=Marinobacter daqiaonensis TaxID=650891 RepID=A0A1I6J8I0_9GAMM|nr:HDOD domain-containing protein [Marinobacter daqiaonensis]SFR75231.1 HD-like signal output (HDOD) domain, no enzymatic activity [Marinobacter daqiaonensis]